MKINKSIDIEDEVRTALALYLTAISTVRSIRKPPMSAR